MVAAETIHRRGNNRNIDAADAAGPVVVVTETDSCAPEADDAVACVRVDPVDEVVGKESIVGIAH